MVLSSAAWGFCSAQNCCLESQLFPLRNYSWFEHQFQSCCSFSLWKTSPVHSFCFLLVALVFSLTHLKVFAPPCFSLHKTLLNCVSAPAYNHCYTVPPITEERLLFLSAVFGHSKNCYHLSLLKLLLQACLKGSNYHKPSCFQIFSTQQNASNLHCSSETIPASGQASCKPEQSYCREQWGVKNCLFCKLLAENVLPLSAGV